MGYFGNGSLIIGIRRRKKNCKFELYDIMINPINYEVQNGDEAIILATDYSHAQRFEDKNNKNEILIEDINYKGELEYLKNYDYDMSSYDKRKSSSKKMSSKADTDGVNDKFTEFLDDTSYLRDHIIVFGPLDSLPSLIECLRHFTNNYICYVWDTPKPERWNQIESKYRNVNYLEWVYSDKNELKRTGIEHARHVILLSWMLEKSNHPDSGILQIIQMIEQYYPTVPYTIELEDESNLKYLSKASEANKLPLNCNNKYAAGKVLYSSTLDAIIAQSYYNDTLFEVLDKLIFGDNDLKETKIEENSRLNMIKVPDELAGVCTYENFFYNCTKVNEEDTRNNKKPVIPIAIYRSKHYDVLGNETPFMMTNPEKGTLLLKDDIVFVLGDSKEQEMKRKKEYFSKSEDSNLKSHPTIIKLSENITEETLNNLDDEKLLDIVSNELAGTEKERKKDLLNKKRNLQKTSKNRRNLEVIEESPKNIQRSVSDVAKLPSSVKKQKKFHELEETKNKSVSSDMEELSSLEDTLKDEELPNELESPDKQARIKLQKQSTTNTPTLDGKPYQPEIIVKNPDSLKFHLTPEQDKNINIKLSNTDSHENSQEPEVFHSKPEVRVQQPEGSCDKPEVDSIPEVVNSENQEEPDKEAVSLEEKIQPKSETPEKPIPSLSEDDEDFEIKTIKTPMFRQNITFTSKKEQ